MNEKLEKLIELALVDGIVTEKEKKVLYKKAAEFKVDIDEFEMILEAKIQLANQANKEDTIEKQKKPQKVGNLKKCPSCGASVSSFEIKCKDCDHEFRDVIVNVSIEKLFKELKAVKRKEVNYDDDDYYEDHDSGFFEKRAGIIRDFPMPTSKEVLLELITRGISELNNINTNSIGDIFQSSTNNSELIAWQSKTEEAIDKLKIASINDKSLIPLISNFENKLKSKLESSEKKVKKHKNILILKYVGMGIICIPGAIILYYFYSWVIRTFLN
jgi:hypothetical protein